MLGEGDNFGINGSFRAPERKLSTYFDKEKTKLSLSLHYNGDNSYLFVKKIYKFKTNDKNVNFPSQFCLGNICNKFGRRRMLKQKKYI